MRTGRPLHCLVRLLLMASLAPGLAAAQTLELPFEIGFSATELGSTLLVPAKNAPHFDVGLGTVVGVHVRVDIDRVCGESMYTNTTGASEFPDVIRNLQIVVADLGLGIPLTPRQPVTTGSIVVEVPAGETVKFNECGGGPSSVLFTGIPVTAVQAAATNGTLGLGIEITPAAPPAGVVLDRYSTFIEGRVTLIWRFEPHVGIGAAGWSGNPTWTNLDQGLEGTDQRIPSFMGTGQLETNRYVGLVLWGVAPGASTYLVAGSAEAILPFKGGVMVPVPHVRVPVTANAEGAVVLTKLLTAHIAGGGSIYLQFWVEDGEAIEGYSASNAIRGTP